MASSSPAHLSSRNSISYAIALILPELSSSLSRGQFKLHSYFHSSLYSPGTLSGPAELFFRGASEAFPCFSGIKLIEAIIGSRLLARLLPLEEALEELLKQLLKRSL